MITFWGQVVSCGSKWDPLCCTDNRTINCMLLTGTYHRTLDEKHRVAVPKSLRDAFNSSESGTIFLAPSTDGAIAVYPEPAFRSLANRLADASPTARQVREYARLFFARATSATLDKQGRLRVPGELVELAQLTREVVLLGLQDHVEIWPKAAWEGYVAARTDHYDDIAEAAFGGAKPSNSPDTN